MLNKDVVLNLNKSVLKRYEPNLDNGTVFLFNIENETYWSGNASVDCLLRLIDGQRTLNDIYNSLLDLFDEYTKEEIISSYNNIIETLISKNFLVISNAV